MVSSHRGCPSRWYWVHLGPAWCSGSLLTPGNKSLSPAPREGGGAALLQERETPCPVHVWDMSYPLAGPCWDLLDAPSCPAGSGTFWKDFFSPHEEGGFALLSFIFRTCWQQNVMVGKDERDWPCCLWMTLWAFALEEECILVAPRQDPSPASSSSWE